MMRQLLLFIIISLACSVNAEQFKITGKVVDAENNEPCIFASVVDVGSRRGVATDFDGNFSIDVEKGAILKFTYMGYYDKLVEVLNDSALVIELEEDPDALKYLPLGYRRPWRPTGPFSPIQPIERDTSKTNSQNQNSVISH